MKLAEVVKKGKHYTTLKFLENVYASPGRIKYQAGTEMLVPNDEVWQYI